MLMIRVRTYKHSHKMESGVVISVIIAFLLYATIVGDEGRRGKHEEEAVGGR